MPGRPRTRPDLFLADRGYSFPGCRKLLKNRNIRHVIPERTDQRRRRASRPGKKPKFDREAYARRNVVERCVNKLKQWRSIATCYDKRALNYTAVIVVAAIYMWLTTSRPQRSQGPQARRRALRPPEVRGCRLPGRKVAGRMFREGRAPWNRKSVHSSDAARCCISIFSLSGE